MPRDPLFSICVPVYNCEKYIDELFKSVSRQSFSDWELIVRDDGSTDSSFEKCLNQTWVPKEKLTLLAGENLGLSKNRCELAQHASGKYILCIDGDDTFFSNDALQRLAEAILIDQPDVVFFNATRNPSSGESIVDYRHLNQALRKASSVEDTRENVFEVLLSSDQINNIPFKAVRRELNIFDQQFPAVQITEDRMFTAVLISKASSFRVLDEVIYFYRLNEASLTRVSFNPRFISDRLAVEDVIDRILVDCDLTKLHPNHQSFKLWMIYSMYCDVRRLTEDYSERKQCYLLLTIEVTRLLQNGLWCQVSKIRPDHIPIALLARFRAMRTLDIYLMGRARILKLIDRVHIYHR